MYIGAWGSRFIYVAVYGSYDIDLTFGALGAWIRIAPADCIIRIPSNHDWLQCPVAMIRAQSMYDACESLLTPRF